MVHSASSISAARPRVPEILGLHHVSLPCVCWLVELPFAGSEKDKEAEPSAPPPSRTAAETARRPLVPLLLRLFILLSVRPPLSLLVRDPAPLVDRSVPWRS